MFYFERLRWTYKRWTCDRKFFFFFLKYLIYGDTVMADRRFNIAGIIGTVGMYIVWIPLPLIEGGGGGPFKKLVTWGVAYSLLERGGKVWKGGWKWEVDSFFIASVAEKQWKDWLLPIVKTLTTSTWFEMHRFFQEISFLVPSSKVLNIEKVCCKLRWSTTQKNRAFKSFFPMEMKYNEMEYIYFLTI